MLLVPRKRIWTQQPPELAKATPEFPYTFLPGSPLYCAGAYQTEIALTNVDSEIGSGGRSAKFSGDGIAKLGSATGLAGGNEITFGVVFENTGAPTGGDVVIFGKEDYNDDGFGIRCPSLGNFYADCKTSTRKQTGLVSATGLITAVATVKNSTLYFSINGSDPVSVVLSAGAIRDATRPLRIGGFTEGPRYFVGRIYAAFAGSNGVSAGRLKQLSANPWQIFKAPDSRIFVPVSAGGVTNESLTADSITTPPATVGSPLLTQNHALTGSAITASSTLSSPTLAQNHSITGSAISTAAATLVAPTVTQNHALSSAAITATPATVGAPTLTEIVAGIIAALPIITANAVFGSPSLAQNHTLSSGAISAGPATFGTPSLAQQHAIMAQGITASAATVGAPALTPGGAPLFTPEQLAYILAYVEANLSVPTASEISAAVLAALQATAIPVNVTQFNGNATTGTGKPGDPVTAV